jgi:hypothetical protein
MYIEKCLVHQCTLKERFLVRERRRLERERRERTRKARKWFEVMNVLKGEKECVR